MFGEFISHHPVLGGVGGFFLIVLTGWIEHRITGQPDATCVTWFMGLLVVVGGIANLGVLGQIRWLLAGLIFIGGTVWLVRYYKKHRHSRGRNRWSLTIPHVHR